MLILFFGLLSSGLLSLSLSVNAAGIHSSSTETQKSYHGYKILRVHPKSADQIRELHGLQELSRSIDFWKTPTIVGKAAEVMIPPHVVEHVSRKLKQANIDHEIVIHNVQTIIENERAQMEAARVRNPSGNFTYDNYYSYDVICNFIKSLALSAPNIAEVSSIGKTYEGRDMLMIKIGAKGNKNPVILIDAGIHAREWIAPPVAISIADQLVNSYKTSKEIRTFVDSIDWYIIPVMNPDGYEYSRTNDRWWRKSRSYYDGICDGVDLNRNFDISWNGEGYNDIHCSLTYSGPKAFSEIEDRNLRDLMLKIQDRNKVYLTFHSYSQIWMTTWGYTQELPPQYQRRCGLATKAALAVKSVRGTEYAVMPAAALYIAPGGSDDYCASLNGTFSSTVELPPDHNHRETGFVLPPELISIVCKEIWEGVKVVGNFVLNPDMKLPKCKDYF